MLHCVYSQGDGMNTATRILATAAALLLTSVAQAADPSLIGGRVGAVDVPKLAKFYEAAFGLKEINRLEMPNLFEIMMNWGDSVEAAKKNTGPQIILMRRSSDAIKDEIPHLILSVPDMTAAVAAVKAAGGKLEGEPRPFGKIVLAFVIDPAGNQIELIQQAKN
jgi:predicted enzyme related to lactoylglutathione lyase